MQQHWLECEREEANQVALSRMRDDLPAEQVRQILEGSSKVKQEVKDQVEMG